MGRALARLVRSDYAGGSPAARGGKLRAAGQESRATGVSVEASEKPEAKPERNFSARAERSLRDADRTLRKVENSSPEERAMVQIEQARVYALLQLADDIRQSRAG